MHPRKCLPTWNSKILKGSRIFKETSKSWESVDEIPSRIGDILYKWDLKKPHHKCSDSLYQFYNVPMISLDFWWWKNCFVRFRIVSPLPKKSLSIQYLFNEKIHIHRNWSLKKITKQGLRIGFSNSKEL